MNGAGQDWAEKESKWSWRVCVCVWMLDLQMQHVDKKAGLKSGKLRSHDFPFFCCKLGKSFISLMLVNVVTLSSGFSVIILKIHCFRLSLL